MTLLWDGLVVWGGFPIYPLEEPDGFLTPIVPDSTRENGAVRPLWPLLPSSSAQIPPSPHILGA